MKMNHKLMETGDDANIAFAHYRLLCRLALSIKASSLVPEEHCTNFVSVFCISLRIAGLLSSATSGKQDSAKDWVQFLAVFR